jgi:hypothetical protein
LLILIYLLNILSPSLINITIGNANEDCFPQEKTPVQKMGYGTFAAVFFAVVFFVCVMFALLLYEYDSYIILENNSNLDANLPKEDEESNYEYALSKIGKDSVYSYFVTDKFFGWLAALATLGIQIGILVVFTNASEHALNNDKADIQYTWKCPRDMDECKNKSDLDGESMWPIFSMLMVAFLAKDMISRSKLIYHSAKVRHSLFARIRYFFGGICLCWITLFALYVSYCHHFCHKFLVHCRSCT